MRLVIVTVTDLKGLDLVPLLLQIAGGSYGNKRIYSALRSLRRGLT